MNVEVRHNNTNITDYVISYSRAHYICSSIGELDLVLSGTYSTDIVPHDQIKIYENGDFKVTYYVSDVGRSVPEGTITLQCQDRSKYIVDYFISDSYNIDYPSYTRYWIETFLDQAGVSYSFQTASQGNLLSNFTQLGLQPAYDQIMMLLQLSGWYMYFDGNGVAIIGALDIDLADSVGLVDKNDILDIKKITDDKMLRNRAVVWGQYDSIRSQYAFADVSVNTPYNYDSRDKRAIVISNNNIPNRTSAYNIANILIKEFAKATIVKHINVDGARDYNLGESLRVNSDVWRGKGLITTFGVTMDRTGLVTNIVLDERCPRLFGFFDFGDYVYVGTFGDGIWRKHIKFDHTFRNFSTGLTNLNITDLHINNGVFGSVGHSGEMFYANSEEGPWNQTILESLESSREDVPSGTVEYVPFSGIMARATIVDKSTNMVKFGVDTFSGLNTGDYFLSYSGLFDATTSGVTRSGTHRGWIVEYNPFTGSLVGGIGSGIYPIVYSGDYNVIVLDLENDGINDYVSVAWGSGLEFISNNQFGSHTTAPVVKDFNSLVEFTDYTYELEGQTKFVTTSLGFATPNFSTFNNELDDERDVVYASESSGVYRFKREHFYLEFSESLGRDQVLSTTLTSPALSSPFLGGICKIAANLYRGFYTLTTGGGTDTVTATTYYVEWNTVSNTLSAPTSIGSQTYTKDVSGNSNEVIARVLSPIIAGKYWSYFFHRKTASQAGVAYPDSNFLKIQVMSVDMLTLATSTGSTAAVIGDGGSGAPVGEDRWNIELAGAGIFQQGTSSVLVDVIHAINSPNGGTQSFQNWLVVVDGTTASISLVQSATGTSDPAFVYVGSEVRQQTTQDHFIYFVQSGSGSTAYLLYNAGSFTTGIGDPGINGSLYTINGPSGSEFIQKIGGVWYWKSAVDLSNIGTVVFPSGYNIIGPFITSATNRELYFWLAERTDNSKKVILKLDRNGNYLSEIIPYNNDEFWTLFNFGYIAGNFFINPISAVVLYVSNTIPNDSGYLILQREGSEFNLIQSAYKPLRIDISNNSPVLSVQDVAGTFQSNYVYGNELTTINPALTMSGLNTDVSDYRYALLETEGGALVSSGAGVTTQALYVTESGIYTSDTLTYSGGFILMESAPSGILSRIETSNYTYPGQFLFVTTSGTMSGEFPVFYQKDNDAEIFIPYSGLPISRPTIIRVDDRF